MSKMLLGVCLGSLLFVFSGCATMFQGSSQSIPVISNPVGAVVTVDGKQVGKTPCTLNLKRKKQATLLIQAEGYDPYMTILQRKKSGWFWGDVLIGLTIWGLVSPIVDMATGAVYVLEPQSLNVELKSQKKEIEEKVKTQKDRPPLVAEPIPLSPTSEELPKIKGLGVSRYAIQSIFEDPAVGFVFETALPVDGLPRVIGSVKNKIATIELIGPSEDVYKAYMMVGIPNDSNDVVALNFIRLAALMKHAIPTWEEGISWLTDSLDRLKVEEEVQTTYDHLIITLTFFRSMGIMTLSISPKAKP